MTGCNVYVTIVHNFINNRHVYVTGCNVYVTGVTYTLQALLGAQSLSGFRGCIFSLKHVLKHFLKQFLKRRGKSRFKFLIFKKGNHPPNPTDQSQDLVPQ